MVCRAVQVAVGALEVVVVEATVELSLAAVVEVVVEVVAVAVVRLAAVGEAGEAAVEAASALLLVALSQRRCLRHLVA